MDALQAVLNPLARILNRNIQESTPARELCRELADTVIAVRVQETALAAYFVIANEILDVRTASEQEPDVVVEGSLLTLARLGGDSREQLLRDGSLRLSGDAEIARQFQQLLDFAKPDLEEELAGVVGDVAAHRIGQFTRSAGNWGREVRATMTANVREYLQEESRDTPSRYEFKHFSNAVNTLRDDVARIEARLGQLSTD